MCVCVVGGVRKGGGCDGAVVRVGGGGRVIRYFFKRHRTYNYVVVLPYNNINCVAFQILNKRARGSIWVTRLDFNFCIHGSPRWCQFSVCKLIPQCTHYVTCTYRLCPRGIVFRPPRLAVMPVIMHAVSGVLPTVNNAASGTLLMISCPRGGHFSVQQSSSL